MCQPYLKLSDPLPETHLFFYLAISQGTVVRFKSNLPSYNIGGMIDDEFL